MTSFIRRSFGSSSALPEIIKQCRICLDEVAFVDNPKSTCEGQDLVSPCCCRGTQKWVHLDCLRAWQNSCIRNGSHGKATTCSVCHSFYSFQPLQESFFFRAKSWLSKGTNPAILLWPALFTLPLLFLLQIVIASLAFSMMSSIANLVFSPLRLFLGTRNTLRDNRGENVRQFNLRTFQTDGTLENTTTIESDAEQAIRSLQPGTVLVASPKVKDGVFSQAIVILERYDRAHGARGVIINKRLSSYERQRVSRRGQLGSERSVWVGNGGPLSQTTVTVLHDLPNIPGSFQLGPGLFVGHYASTRYLELEHASHSRMKVLFGCSSWSPNQLERELHVGIWTVFPCQPHETASHVFTCS